MDVTRQSHTQSGLPASTPLKPTQGKGSQRQGQIWKNATSGNPQPARAAAIGIDFETKNKHFCNKESQTKHERKTAMEHRPNTAPLTTADILQWAEEMLRQIDSDILGDFALDGIEIAEETVQLQKKQRQRLSEMTADELLDELDSEKEGETCYHAWDSKNTSWNRITADILDWREKNPNPEPNPEPEVTAEDARKFFEDQAKAFCTDVMKDLLTDLESDRTDLKDGLSQIHMMAGSLIGAIAEIDEATTAEQVLTLTDCEEGNTEMALWGDQDKDRHRAYRKQLQEIADWKAQLYRKDFEAE